MRQKELATRKINQLENALNNISAYVSQGAHPQQLKLYIDQVKEKLEELQTLINAESESWN